jgi:release factor glutamine methyltransferase
MQATLIFIKEQLRNFYPDSEIKSFCYLMMESVCGFDKHSVLRDKDKHLSQKESLRIQEIIEELKKYRPIQYILGETEFYGLKFQVNENVLIPRPETEELVERVIRDCACSDGSDLCSPSILDIGTGSGCIAVALAKNLPQASVYALDISENALGVARRNAAINNVNVRFFRQDIRMALSSGFPETWDVIVSNPPYVTPAEKEIMQKNVLDYEPHEALFVPQENPLLFYERIADIGLQRLAASGTLYFEINALYGAEVVEMLKAKNYRKIHLFQDISGKDRIVVAKWKKE